MPYAGHVCKVKVSGSPLSLTDEPTTTSDDLTFQITDSNKRILAPDEDITVKVDGSPVSSGFTLNRLNGSVTFDSPQTGATVTISGSYLPTSDVAEAYEMNYALEANNETAPRFNSQFQRRVQTQKDLSIELSAWHDVNETVFFDAINNGNTMVIEFYINDILDFRAWVKSASDEIDTSADGLIEESIEFEGTTDKDERMIHFG
jgi:hypothetical protein